LPRPSLAGTLRCQVLGICLSPQNGSSRGGAAHRSCALFKKPHLEELVGRVPRLEEIGIGVPSRHRGQDASLGIQRDRPDDLSARGQDTWPILAGWAWTGSA
jgi:hypothetical protein